MVAWSTTKLSEVVSLSEESPEDISSEVVSTSISTVVLITSVDAKLVVVDSGVDSTVGSVSLVVVVLVVDVVVVCGKLLRVPFWG